jgi:hypothetical protein
MPISLNGTNGIVFPDNSLQTAAASPFGLKNRIINGDMVIDQRNAGASVSTPSLTYSVYTLDRWAYEFSQAAKATIQQNAGSVTPPSGFSNYLGITSTSAYSVTSGDYFGVAQRVEGFNIADLAWGTANAQTITLSFRVRSSLTGTFGGSLRNSGNGRSYPFTYTISSANTWTTISITIPGDTSGTWLTNNGTGITLNFGLGVGSTASGTAGSWSSSNFNSATGAVSVVGTNGATWYITGVQLERNTTATPFEWIPYSTELALCQRYLPAWNFTAVNQPSAAGIAYSTTATVMNLIHPVQTRVLPTGISVTGTFNSYNNAGGNSGNFSSITLGASQGTYSSIINCTGGSGLVQGNATILLSPAGTSQILLTGCEL